MPRGLQRIETELDGTEREREVSSYFTSPKSPGFQLSPNHESTGRGDISVNKWDCSSEREAVSGSESRFHSPKNRNQT